MKDLRNRLKNWRQAISTLEDPKARPNDFQRLVLNCADHGMNTRDIGRVFGISQPAVQDWHKRYGPVATEPDKIYFMRRARALGAEDDVIAQWFGFERVDQVSMLLAEE